MCGMFFKLFICHLTFVTVSPGLHAFEDETTRIFRELSAELTCIESRYAPSIERLELALADERASFVTANSTEAKMRSLIRREEIREEIRMLKLDSVSEISKVRYLKGLQIIKILYEKVLGLDHHFASVRTLGEINRIANPTQYPEYAKLQETLAEKKDRRGFDLSAILGTNAIVSVVQTFTNMLGSGLSREEKEKQLASVECILDFTLRMQNDLNTIYFETAFLQTSNVRMKQEIEVLFRDYAKPIGYVATLENCRAHDDWETFTQKMDEYLVKLKSTTGTAQYKMQVNMEFPIDRLLQYITQYNAYIEQGGKFYEKFRIILNSYENQKACETRLPPEYLKLRSDIDVAIEKFNVAYRPVEINGSKMKEILYGLNEFD